MPTAAEVLAHLEQEGAYPAIQAMLRSGWTVEAAFSHANGECDQAVCTGDH